jgi:ribonuclease J
MAGPQGELVFAPLGGVGEIGMNLAIYGLGDQRRRTWLIVDVGVSFAQEENLPGIDLIFPDIRYLVEERRNIAGIVLTHAHEDHYGAMLDLWPKLKVPVYATPFTAALLEAKRQGEYGMEDIPVTEMALGSRLNIGPFDIELVSVAIRSRNPMRSSCARPTATCCTPATGSSIRRRCWARRPTRPKLRALGAEGCHVLIGDSTNAVRDGPLAVGIRRRPDLDRADREGAAPRRGDDLRLQRGAHQGGRRRGAPGRARDRRGRPRHGARHRRGARDRLSQGRAAVSRHGYLRPSAADKVVALCTGSQGEARAALARIAQDEHPEVALSKGDRVIFSSRPIPGNEKAIGKVINGLIDQGVEVITDRTHLFTSPAIRARPSSKT